MTRKAETQSLQRFRASSGGRIDRSEPLSFTFDGRHLTGYAGDTLASALLANGVHMVARSFKYHRPRGIMSAGSEEPNALVTIRRDWRRVTPNLRATEVELYEGLQAESQNRWPSLALDVGSVNDRMAPLIPAGFYYKTFMGPKAVGGNRAWTHLFEPAIRRMAGLGRAPIDADPDHYASRYAHCDVLVAGAGPAGLVVALTAAEAGASVIIADEQAEFGGSLLAETEASIDGQPAWGWLAATIGRLRRHDRVRLLQRTTVFGCYTDHLFGLAERITDHLDDPDPALPRERLWQVRAREVVLATGAIERPLVFRDNDRPGIMLAGAAATYRERYGVLAGTRAVIATVCDSAYPLAARLARDGVRVERVVDLRPGLAPALAEIARATDVVVSQAATIKATAGRNRVSAVGIKHGDGRGERIECDLLLMAGGFTPTLHLYSQLRGKLAWDEARQAFWPQGALDHVHLAGGCIGVSGLAGAIEGGIAAGETAARAVGRSATAGQRVVVDGVAPWDTVASTAAPPSISAPNTKGRAFVDFQNDVTTKDLQLAAQEGFRSVEHIKRYTTTGMATDQGRTSNVNALGVVAAALGQSVATLGHTTFRAPYTPVTFGTLAAEARGFLFDPVRRTPIDGAARAAGAVFEDVGQWQRARYFPRAGETFATAVSRECRAVREQVGVFDASTLGKIEVVGPDAAAFLDRMYVNDIAGLGVGRCRYAILLSEAGFIMDDGIVARLAPDRFHVTTTTGGAARVLAHMEDFLQTEFTDLTCWLTSVTEQWGVIAVQGPRARELLVPLVDGVDLSGAALPHMGFAAGSILGVPMRLFRVSFTGELGFEVNVPSGRARGVWDALLARAEAVGGAAYGTEAMHVLRAEKGFIIVGQESDGTVTPADLGLPTGVRKCDFVGKRSLARPDMLLADRPQLVGLECSKAAVVLEEGAQITDTATPRPGTRALGHVTSAYMSPALGRPIALALIQGGRARIGETLYVPMPGGVLRVSVVAPWFYDAQGVRLDG